MCDPGTYVCGIYSIESSAASPLIIATGRSDFSNQVNNALASSIIPTTEKILPDVFDKQVVENVKKTRNGFPSIPKNCYKKF